MVNEKVGRLDSLTKLEEVDNGIFLYRLIIDLEEYLTNQYFGVLEDMQGSEIQFTTVDINTGDVVVKNFISELKLCSHVKVLDDDSVNRNSLLYTSGGLIEDRAITISLSDITIANSHSTTGILYLEGVTINNTARSKYIGLNVRDRNNKKAMLKLWLDRDADATRELEYSTKAVGKYIEITVKRDIYGYTAEEFVPSSIKPTLADEVILSRRYIAEELKDDLDLTNYIQSKDYLKKLSEVYQNGFGKVLVRIARELKMVAAIHQSAEQVDVQLLRRLIITSRGYLLLGESKYSPVFGNLLILVQSALKKDDILISAIDVKDDKPKEYFVFKNLCMLSETLERVDLEEEFENDEFKTLNENMGNIF